MLKKLLILCLIFLSLHVFSQENPLFWKNYSFYNPAFVDTDTTNYTDVWYQHERFSLPNRDFGILHNYTLKDQLTNIGFSTSYDKTSNRLQGSTTDIKDFEINSRISHKLHFKKSALIMGVGLSFNNSKHKEIIEPAYSGNTVTRNFAASILYLNLGLNYVRNGLCVAASLNDMHNNYGYTYKYLIQYEFKNVKRKITPYFKSDQISKFYTVNGNFIDQIGLRTEFRVLTLGYSHYLISQNLVNEYHNYSNSFFIGFKILKKAELNFALNIRNKDYSFYTDNLRTKQINLSYVWDK